MYWNTFVFCVIMALALNLKLISTFPRSGNKYEFVTRAGWEARIPEEKSPLKVPVPYVVIHHTYIPTACHLRTACCESMRSMQDFHMDIRNWSDIGYNFCVGSDDDGSVYEGRGFKTLGAHALHFNNVSLGIALIGDWTETLPPESQMKAAKALIQYGVTHGYIRPDYRVIGHRQVRDTECPGDALFEEIKTWDQWSKHPASVDELLQVEELSDKVKQNIRKNGY